MRSRALAGIRAVASLVSMFALLVLAAMAAPLPASGQTCLGIPGAPGQTAIGVGVELPDGGTSYTAVIHHETAGPLSFAVNYALTSVDNVDSKMNTFGGLVAYRPKQSEKAPFEFCPVAGGGYSRISQAGTTVSAITIPVGVGFGAKIPLDPKSGLMFVPSAVPQLIYNRAKVSDDFYGSVSDSKTNLGVDLGATLAAKKYFARLGLLLTNEDGNGSVLNIGVGLFLK